MRQFVHRFCFLTVGILLATSLTAAPTAPTLPPAQQNGLVLWLNADTVEASDGDLIRLWKDSSGQGSDLAQPMTANAPVYEKKKGAGVTFDGVRTFLQVSKPVNVRTIFMVAGYDAATQKPLAALITSATSMVGYVDIGIYFDEAALNPGSGFGALQASDGGALLRAVATQTTPWNGFFLGGDRAIANRYAAATIHEVLVYNRELPATEIAAVEKYLRAHWDKVLSEGSGEAVYGRTVRIEHRSDNPGIGIELAEVEVFSNGQNIAARGNVRQSSTWGDQGGAPAELAIDGNKGDWGSARSVSMTNQKARQWWELEFNQNVPIETIAVYNRTDGPPARFHDATLMVLNENREVIWEKPLNYYLPEPKQYPVTAMFKEKNGKPAGESTVEVPTLDGPWPVWNSYGTERELPFPGGQVTFPATGSAAEIRYSDLSSPGVIRLTAAGSTRHVVEDGINVVTLSATAELQDGKWRFVPILNGLRIEAAATIKSGAPPMLDLILDAPENGVSRPLFNRSYSAIRLDGLPLSGFVGAVKWKKFHAGGAPLSSLSFDLGGRRLELNISKSVVKAALITEADGTTHLQVIPAEVRAGVRRRCAVELRLLGPDAPSVASVPDSLSVDQQYFRATLNPDGELSLFAGLRGYSAGNVRKVLAGWLTVETDGSAHPAAGKLTAPSREFQPKGEKETFALLTGTTNTGAVETAQSVRCLWRNMKSQRPETLFEIDLTVRPLVAGVKRVSINTELISITIPPIRYSDFKFDEARVAVRGATDRPFTYKGEPLAQPITGVRLLEATYQSTGKADNYYSATRAVVEPIACGSARLLESANSFAQLELTPEGVNGKELTVGKSYHLKYRVRLSLLGTGETGPLQIVYPHRRAPFYTLPAPIAIELRIPAGAGTLTAVAHNDDAGGGQKPVTGTLTRVGIEKTPLGNEEVWKWTGKRSAPGVTAVTVRLKNKNGAVLSTRKVEAVSIGNLGQPEIANETLPDEKLMNLKLVDEINCADEKDPHPRFDFPGKSSIVETAIGKCRSIGNERNASMMWEFKVKNRHKAHLVVVEYPDNAFRFMSMGVVEPCDPKSNPAYKDGVSQANGLRTGPGTGVQTGWPYPLSGKLRRMSLVYWAARANAYVGVSPTMHTPDWNPESTGAATVQRIRIYEINGRLPAPRIPHPVAGRLIGPFSENQRAYSTFGSDFADDEGPVHGLMSSKNMVNGTDPRFYARLYNAFRHYLEYLRFSGQNMTVDGLHRYSNSTYPGLYPGGWDSPRDVYELLARMGSVNGVKVQPAIEASHTISPFVTNLIQKEGDRISRDSGAVEPTVVFIDKTGKRLVDGLQGAGQPNFTAPEVWGDLVRIAEDMARYYVGVPGISGVTLLAGTWLRPSWDATAGFSGVASGDQGLDVSYDDRTIARFCKETGVTIPVAIDDTDRYRKRYAWLMDNAKEAWIAWRCRMLTALVSDMRQATTAYGLRLSLLWGPHPFESDWWTREALNNPEAALLDMRKTGYDPVLFNQAGEITGAGYWDGLRSRNNWPSSYIGSGVQGAILENGPARALFDNGADSAVFLFNAFRESRYPFNDYFKTFRWRDLQIAGGGEQMKFGCVYGWPGPDYGAHDFLRLTAFATPPATITHTWIDVNTSENNARDLRRFAVAFQSLPLCRYDRLSAGGLAKNLVVRRGQTDGKTYLMVANPTWSALTAVITFPAAEKVTDLVRDTVSLTTAVKGLTLTLQPYDLKVLRLENGGTPNGATTTIPEQSLAWCRAELAKGEALLAAWWNNLTADNADRKTLVTETAAARQALKDGDLFAALQIKDGVKLRGALQHLIQPPAQIVSTPPQADAATTLLVQFDEGSGAPVEVGAGKRAFTGNANYVEGQFGKALAGGEVKLPLAKEDPLLNGGSFTIEFWLKPAGNADWVASPPYFGLIGLKNTDGQEILNWYWAGRDKNAQPIQDIVLFDGGKMPSRLQYYTAWNARNWRHMALVYDKDAQQNNLRLYIDGRLEDQTMTYRPLIPHAQGATMQVGSAQIHIDALRISSKARTVQEIGFPANYDSRSWASKLRE
jgi:hypothetical protein